MDSCRPKVRKDLSRPRKRGKKSKARRKRDILKLMNQQKINQEAGSSTSQQEPPAIKTEPLTDAEPLHNVSEIIDAVARNQCNLQAGSSNSQQKPSAVKTKSLTNAEPLPNVSEVLDASTRTEYVIGRRNVNVNYLIKSLQKLNDHGGANCNFSDMTICGETTEGSNYGVELSCRVCFTSAVVWLEDPDDKLMPMRPCYLQTTQDHPATLTSQSKPQHTFRVPVPLAGSFKPQSTKLDPLKNTKTYLRETPIPTPPSDNFQLKNFFVPEPLTRLSLEPQSSEVNPYKEPYPRKIPAPPPDNFQLKKFPGPLPIARSSLKPQSNKVKPSKKTYPQKTPTAPNSRVKKSSLKPQSKENPYKKIYPRKTPAPPPDKNVLVPVPLARSYLKPQSNEVTKVTTMNQSHLTNLPLVNHPPEATPIIKQEVTHDSSMSQGVSSIPQSLSDIPTSVQLLFCVDQPGSSQINSPPSSSVESFTVTPDIVGGNQSYVASSLGTSASSESMAIIPDIYPAEVLPLDLNLVKKEMADEPGHQSMDVNDNPGVRLLPMSVTSLDPSKTLFVSENPKSSITKDILEASSSANGVVISSVMSCTKTSTTFSETATSNVPTVSGAPTFIDIKNTMHEVTPCSKEDVFKRTADGDTLSQDNCKKSKMDI